MLVPQQGPPAHSSRPRGGHSPQGGASTFLRWVPKFGIRQDGHGNFDWQLGGGLWSAAPTSTRRVPILGAAGAENWHFWVAIPMEITSLGSFRNADVPISSEAHVRSGNLVSDSRSDHGKVLFLRVLCGSFGFSDFGHVVLPPPRGKCPPLAHTQEGVERRLPVAGGGMMCAQRSW